MGRDGAPQAASQPLVPPPLDAAGPEVVASQGQADGDDTGSERGGPTGPDSMT